PDIRQSIESTFHDLATGQEPALAATGLLSLHLLGTVQGAGAVPVNGGSLPPGMSAQGTLEKPTYHLPDSTLQPMVDAILKAPPSAAAIAPRMTALRIVSDRKLADSRPLIRSLIESGDEHTLVRMAAIGTLGILKNPADRPLLESLDCRDLRIGRAIKAALVSLP
ncbi:MAG: hypothetical protein JWN14_2024, partial [Chthonomonadales bacterium]|nr:hypothetical protein [Chthonomonadales bacterium]